MCYNFKYDHKSLVGPIFGLFYVNYFATKPSVNDTFT